MVIGASEFLKEEMIMSQEQENKGATPYKLSPLEKAWVFLVAFFLFFGAAWLLYCPPEIKAFSPNADSKGLPSYISYDVAWQLPVVLLLGAAGLLIFAINGRRLVSANWFQFDGPTKPESSDVKAAKKDGAEFDKQPQSADANETNDSPSQPQSSVEDSSGEPADPTSSIDGLGVFTLEALPLKIVKYLVEREIQSGNATLREFRYALHEAKGKGSRPWYFRFRNRTKLLKLTLGGRGKDGPSWADVETKPG